MIKDYNELLYPNKTLLNKFYITDASELSQKERQIVAYNSVKASRNLKNFSLKSLLKLHNDLFGDVYNWAGTLREVDIEKPERILKGMSIKYYPHETLTENLNEFMNQVNEMVDRKVPPKDKINDFIELFSILWQIHPFYEGNTRTTSLFMEKVAEKCNLNIDFKKLYYIPTYLRNSLVLYTTFEPDKQKHFVNLVQDSLIKDNNMEMGE